MTGTRLGEALARGILRAAEKNTGLLYRMTTTVSDVDGKYLWDPANPPQVSTSTHIELGDSFPNAQPGDHILTPAEVKFEEPDAWAYLQGGEAKKQA